MKRLIAFLVSFSYLVQLFSPILVLADEGVVASTSEAQVVIQESPSSPPASEPTPSAPPTSEPVPATNTEVTPAPVTQAESSPTPIPQSTASPASTSSDSPAPTPISSPPPQEGETSVPLQKSGEPTNQPTLTADASLSSTPASPSATLSDIPNGPAATPSASLLQTGDSIATADITSVSNISLQDSCLKIQSVQLQGNDSGDFSDPACVDALGTANEATPESTLTTADDQPSLPSADSAATPSAQQNTGSDTTQLAVVANTGENNLTTDGDGALLTGDAIALAQLQQLMNLSLTDSSLWLLFITLLPSFNGDIVLPTPEMIARQLAGYDLQSGNPDLTNQAQLQNAVGSSANSGQNNTSGSSAYGVTGDAFAAANIFTMANSEVSDALWYILWLNVAGQWGGYVYSWQPGSGVLKYDPYQTAILAGFGSPSLADTGSDCQNGSCGADQVSNQAVVANSVYAQANTGNNSLQASGSAAMQTGKAISLVNLVALLNSRITNSRIFLGFLNILGDWQGSVRLARPELSVALHSDQTAVKVGDQVAYTIDYRNKGYDRASAVSLAFQIPQGTQYLSSSLTPTEQMSNEVVVWDIGQLGKGQGGSITVLLQVKEWSALQAQATQPAGWWQKLVPVVQAAEESRHFTVSTAIATVDDQSSTRDNRATFTTTVYPLTLENGQTNQFQGESTQQLDEGSSLSTDEEGAQEFNQSDAANALLWPIDLKVSNNVNSYVYPGDTVQFWVSVKNMGDAPLRNATVTHQLVDDQGQFLTVVFPLGNLPAHKEGRLSFGLTVPPMTLSGPLMLHSQTVFHGRLDTGQRVYSPQQETSFLVQPKLLNFHWKPLSVPVVPTVQANDGQVLGASTTKSNTPADQPPAWMLFLSLLIAFLSARTLRYRIKHNNGEESEL
jgi:uncharacterized repeat protein (TIGR01451 family)